MDRETAIAQFASLAAPTRLAVLSALLQAADGLAAFEIAAITGLQGSTLSGHLAHLLKAGMVSRRKAGRTLVYAAVPGTLADLRDFLVQFETRAIAAPRFRLIPVSLGTFEASGLRAALQRNNLPADDFGAEGQRYFALADGGGTEFGHGGIEGAGADQLLRSLIIHPPMRGRGAGQALVRLLEAEARMTGAQRLWLLTQDAERFFARLRYRTATRTEAPKAIMRTKQFASLCPASAKLMVRELIS